MCTAKKMSDLVNNNNNDVFFIITTGNATTISELALDRYTQSKDVGM